MSSLGGDGSLEETQPLLPSGSRSQKPFGSRSHSRQKKHIGIFSAVFIIFNRIIGAGIVATPATVLAMSGSVGLSFFLWALGAVIAAAGMQVYIVWGTAFPRNGGEKNYLEYLFPNPKHLVTCAYAANAVLMAWSAGNALIFSEYTLSSILSQEPSPEALQFVAFVCVTSTVILHGVSPKWGLWLQNILGLFKFFVLAIIIATGFVALRDGIPASSGSSGDRWRGRRNFENIWAGTTANASSICLGLYSVIWSFMGFSNANYALSEMHNPARTIRIAGPLAVVVAAALYLLANVAYFSAASKEEIVNSRRLVAALLMHNVWGPRAERWVDIGVSCCALGNVLAVSFAQARVNQALGQEGVLPFSELWASNWPYGTPLAGLALHWLPCVLVIFFVPPGDAYNFVINVISYPLAVINAVISFGLIYLFVSAPSTPSECRLHAWRRLSPAVLVSAVFFGVANVFLFAIPLTKPPQGAEPYQNLPYWTHAAAGWGVFAIGAIGWAVGYRTGRVRA